MTTKIELAKTATNLVVGASTGFCISSVIQNNATVTNTKEKVEVAVGSYVLGAIVAEAARDWTNSKIDAAVGWWKSNVKKS